MTKSFLIISVVALLFSCKSNTDSTRDTVKDSTVKSVDSLSSGKPILFQFEGDSVVVTPFEIEITLSPKAKDRIVGQKETIIIDVYLTGTPIDSSKVELEEDGSFFVGSAEREISFGQIATFDNLKFSRKIYDQLVDKDVNVNVNVYTGRKTSPDNLIDGGYLDDKLSNVINKRNTLHGKLITGDE